MQETTARTEQSNRDSDVLQHTPLLKEPLWTSPPSAGCWQIAQATTRSSTQCQCPGAPLEPQHCAPPRSSSCPAQALLSQHPTPTGSHPWRPQGQVSPEAISCAVWTPRGRGRKGQRPCSGELPLANFSPPLPALDTPGQRETRSAALSALQQCSNSLNGNELDFWSMHFSSCWKGKRRTTHTPG